MAVSVFQSRASSWSLVSSDSSLQNSELLPINNSSALVFLTPKKNLREFLLGTNQASYIKSSSAFCCLFAAYVPHSVE